MVPAHIGIPFDWLFDYEKSEGPDPADWVGRSYAVVNIDARGSWNSGDDLRYFLCKVDRSFATNTSSWFETPEREHGYDAVERLAKLPWCNSVCMAGTSWFALDSG